MFTPDSADFAIILDNSKEIKIEYNTGEISCKAQKNANELVTLENTDYRRNI